MATLASATLKLWIYDGLINSYTGTPQYTITKTKLSGETTILFEISELIKDYVQISFDGNYDTAKLSSWASWEITNTFDDTPATTSITKGTRLVTHGYGYFENEINPQLTNPLQQSNTCIYWKKGEKVRIPLYKENELYSVEFFEGATSTNTQTFGKVIIDLTADTTDYNADTTFIRADATAIMSGNSKNITSGINATVGTDKVVITTEDNKTITLSITYVDECKNTPYKVTFLNKFGSLQDIWFFGRRKESANITREEYKINTVQATATTKFYPTYSPTNRVHNLESDKSLVLNTGFVCEEYNEVVQQMMQSEYVWIHEDNRVYPVTPSDNTIDYKNERYDKLLNFTVRFDYAFSELNSVR
tara:strand:+ start:718 stop:1803 length:1086 start_codon:yes stop_codon:yes gene_type:complete